MDEQGKLKHDILIFDLGIILINPTLDSLCFLHCFFFFFHALRDHQNNSSQDTWSQDYIRVSMTFFFLSLLGWITSLRVILSTKNNPD